MKKENIKALLRLVMYWVIFGIINSSGVTISHWKYWTVLVCLVVLAVIN